MGRVEASRAGVALVGLGRREEREVQGPAGLGGGRVMGMLAFCPAVLSDFPFEREQTG